MQNFSSSHFFRLFFSFLFFFGLFLIAARDSAVAALKPGRFMSCAALYLYRLSAQCLHIYMPHSLYSNSAQQRLYSLANLFVFYA
jgi:hypothetical protein